LEFFEKYFLYLGLGTKQKFYKTKKRAHSMRGWSRILNILFLGIIFFPFVSAISIGSGTILQNSDGGNITFSFDVNVTMVEIESDYIYLEGISYARGGTSYSCNLNHTSITTIDSASFCVSSTTTTTSTGGSGGGTFKPSAEIFKNGYVVNVVKNRKVEIPFGDEKEIVEVKSVESEKVSFSVEGKDYEVVLGGETKIDLDDDGIYDLKISNSKIYNEIATLKFELISEEVPVEIQEKEKENIIEKIPEIVEGISWKIYILIGVIFVLIIVWVFLVRKKSKKTKSRRIKIRKVKFR